MLRHFKSAKKKMLSKKCAGLRAESTASPLGAVRAYLGTDREPAARFSLRASGLSTKRLAPRPGCVPHA
jgi:hypothetical protein